MLNIGVRELRVGVSCFVVGFAKVVQYEGLLHCCNDRARRTKLNDNRLVGEKNNRVTDRYTLEYCCLR